jgi:hypothetical protein
MEIKEFLEQFVVTSDMVETDMEEIYCRALEENEALKKLVERAFKLGVAEGLASAEYAITRVLKIKVDDMDASRNLALRTVMKMSERCYRAIKEQPEVPLLVVGPSSKRPFRNGGPSGRAMGGRVL